MCVKIISERAVSHTRAAGEHQKRLKLTQTDDFPDETVQRGKTNLKTDSLERRRRRKRRKSREGEKKKSMRKERLSWLGIWGSSQCPSPFQSASARSESLKTRTGEMKEAKGDSCINKQKRRSTDGVKNMKQEKEKTVEEIREIADQENSNVNLNRDQTLAPWESCAVQQKYSTHRANEFVQTLKRRRSAPGGLGRT